MYNKYLLLSAYLLNLVYGNTNNYSLIIATDFHNNIPDELNNNEFLSFWTTYCRRIIANINNDNYIGFNNECLLTFNDLYCSGSNSTRTSCIEFNYGLESYDNDYDALTLYQNYPQSNQVSIKAFPLIPIVLVFYVAPAAIQIIGEITFKILQQQAQERENRNRYFSQIIPMNYNNQNILSILRNNFCLTQNSIGNSIFMNDCSNNNNNQRFTSILIDNSRQIYNIKNNNGLCLDVEWGLRSNGAKVIFFTCNQGLNQQWVKDIANRFHPMHAFDKCLDISRSSISNGASVIIWTCDNVASNQKYI